MLTSTEGLRAGQEAGQQLCRKQGWSPRSSEKARWTGRGSEHRAQGWGSRTNPGSEHGGACRRHRKTFSHKGPSPSSWPFRILSSFEALLKAPSQRHRFLSLPTAETASSTDSPELPLRLSQPDPGEHLLYVFCIRAEATQRQVLIKRSLDTFCVSHLTPNLPRIRLSTSRLLANTRWHRRSQLTPGTGCLLAKGTAGWGCSRQETRGAWLLYWRGYF